MNIQTIRIKSFITTSFASLAALSLILYTPFSAYAAAEAAPATTECTPAISTPGVSRPSGADAATYTYNCAGFWENDYFIYSPPTGTYSNKTEPTYTYNTATGKYDFPVWVYNAPSNSYVSLTNSTALPPFGAVVIGAPAPTPVPVAPQTPAPGTQTISNTGAGSNNQISNDGSGGAAAINGTGASSNNVISSTGQDKATGNYVTVATVNNVLNSQAGTGNAIVIGNTTAGNVNTGNATAMANVVNLLQSATNAFGQNGNLLTFVANIDGDVNGDLLLNPASLAAIQPAGAQLPGNQDLTVNVSTGATINNNIKLAAASGDATASQNTTVGNTTTGNAQAVANIINIIDSAISSGQSFLGVININGNFNGDILLPPNFVDQLLAANVPTVTIDTTGANSNNTVTNTGANSTDISNTSNSGITNNTKAGALSGNANSNQNTTSGNTASGTASTNITAFNLTGSNVVGANNLLVFVNVLGTWVGLIVNAPVGTSAASLGGGIAQNVPSGTNSTTINNNTNQRINNNVEVTAKSGDANVTQNTIAGDTKTGDAKAAINLLNITQSRLSLSNWFGVLFINVFGTWRGSFGVNTSAGDPIALPTGSGLFGKPNVAASANTNTYRVFSFAPRPAPNSVANKTVNDKTPIVETGKDQKIVVASATVQPGSALGFSTKTSPAASPAKSKTSQQNMILIASVAMGSLALIFLASDTIGRYRRRIG